MNTGNREQNCTMEGGLQYLHKAGFILFSKSFVQRMASCTCMSCIFKNNNNINNNFRLAAYISRCAFLTCQHSTFPAGRAHTIYLFSIARFHDNIIKILLLASLCFTGGGYDIPGTIQSTQHFKYEAFKTHYFTQNTELFCRYTQYSQVHRYFNSFFSLVCLGAEM